MQLVFGQDEQVASFVGLQLGMKFARPFVAIGVEVGGDLKGGAVYNQWNGWNIEVSIYGPGLASREIIKALIWGYPFNDIGAGRLTARTRRANKVVQKLLPRLGFTFEGMNKRYYGPARADDAMVFHLMREQAEGLYNGDR